MKLLRADTRFESNTTGDLVKGEACMKRLKADTRFESNTIGDLVN